MLDFYKIYLRHFEDLMYDKINQWDFVVRLAEIENLTIPNHYDDLTDQMIELQRELSNLINRFFVDKCTENPDDSWYEVRNKFNKVIWSSSYYEYHGWLINELKPISNDEFDQVIDDLFDKYFGGLS